jgi:hypothetical protein
VDKVKMLVALKDQVDLQHIYIGRMQTRHNVFLRLSKEFVDLRFQTEMGAAHQAQDPRIILDALFRIFDQLIETMLATVADGKEFAENSERAFREMRNAFETGKMEH